MQKTALFYKRVGETPLESIKRFKNENPKFMSETISYAGRLDPMAEGVLLLLLGGENKNRKKYQDLDKEYETEIVLGVTTDTFDSLGIIVKSLDQTPLGKRELNSRLKRLVGKNLQEYPPYSSKAVRGKPLYWWARNNKISEIELPKRNVEIYDIKKIGERFASGKVLRDEVVDRLSLVNGDFRQKEILLNWDEFGLKNKDKEFKVVKLHVSCSSGTYIRRLASDLGGMCLTIKRTKINF